MAGGEGFTYKEALHSREVEPGTYHPGGAVQEEGYRDAIQGDPGKKEELKG